MKVFSKFIPVILFVALMFSAAMTSPALAADQPNALQLDPGFSVTNVTRVGSTPTNAGSVDFTVTFSEDVQDVDVNDFTPSGTVTGASITNVTGSGASYTVSVFTGTGDGTLSVNVLPDNIHNLASEPLLNGFTSGETYTLDRTNPIVTLPSHQTVEATSASGAVVSYSGESATDETDPATPTVSCLPASGSTFALGDTLVTCSATDTAGNIGTATFTITVQDTTAPTFTFSVTSPTNSLDIPVSFANVTDAVGTTDYLIVEGGATPPAVDDPAWVGTVPTTYTVLVEDTYILYPWVKDAAGNISAIYGTGVSVTVDVTAPTVSLFTAKTPNNTLDIPITSFEASDNTTVIGYKITATSTPPAANAAGWTASEPATFHVPSSGTYFLYPWVKDMAGNVSVVSLMPIMVSVDTVKPYVGYFTVTTPSSSLDIPITLFLGYDNFSVAGYKVTTSNIPPLPSATGWMVKSPTAFHVAKVGTYTLYPWVKDAAGNVSIAKLPRTVVVCPSTAVVTSTADSGTGSLRQAIVDVCVNGNITFSSALSGKTVALKSTLTISKNLTIDGSTLSSQIKISGDSNNDGAGDLRIFYINNTAPNAAVTLNSLNLTKGKAPSDNYGGGSIYSRFGVLSVINCTFNGNTAPGSKGGAISNHLNSRMTISNSTFSGNSAVSGGSIANLGTVKLDHDVFSNNTASSDGGGVYHSGSNASLQILNSSFSNNSALRYGGGIYSPGSVSINNSTLSDNSANYGGGIYGGVHNSPTSQLIVNNSTFSANSAKFDGGGVYVNGNTLVLAANSTFFGNSAARNGGGIFNSGNTLQTIHATFSGNSAASGGGVYNSGTNTWLYLWSTIIANSKSDKDCVNTGTLESDITNLIEKNSNCGTPVSTADPKLGALASNGGPTKTLALLSGSPAIGKGNATICATTPIDNKDQRGYVRTIGAKCDIGAFEFNSHAGILTPHTASTGFLAFLGEKLGMNVVGFQLYQMISALAPFGFAP